jgi:di/tripeptidase
MEGTFKRIFEEARSEEVQVSVTRVGERPCMGRVDLEKIARMAETVAKTVREVTGILPVPTAMSTDCNIPFSLGIPAVMIGVCEGGGAHTRQEWIRKETFPLGLEVGIKLALAMTEDET